MNRIIDVMEEASAFVCRYKHAKLYHSRGVNVIKDARFLLERFNFDIFIYLFI